MIFSLEMRGLGYGKWEGFLFRPLRGSLLFFSRGLNVGNIFVAFRVRGQSVVTGDTAFSVHYQSSIGCFTLSLPLSLFLFFFLFFVYCHCLSFIPSPLLIPF
jgi:hypothetical protein